MTQQEFLAMHPDFSWWVGMMMLLGLVALCAILARYQHPLAEHHERDHYYGTFMLWALIATALFFVAWPTWLIFRREFWSLLHYLLS